MTYSHEEVNIKINDYFNKQIGNRRDIPIQTITTIIKGVKNKMVWDPKEQKLSTDNLDALIKEIADPTIDAAIVIADDNAKNQAKEVVLPSMTDKEHMRIATLVNNECHIMNKCLQGAHQLVTNQDFTTSAQDTSWFFPSIITIASKLYEETKKGVLQSPEYIQSLMTKLMPLAKDLQKNLGQDNPEDLPPWLRHE